MCLAEHESNTMTCTVSPEAQHDRQPDLACMLMPAMRRGFRLREGSQRRYSGPQPGSVPSPEELPRDVDQGQRRGNDPALHAFVDASDAGVAERALADLLQHSARPLIAGIVGQKIRQGGRSLATVDPDDITADVMARIVGRLMDLRSGRDAEPIGNFSGYVAVATYNGWHQFLRACFPERARLKNRLRYIASHHPPLGTWTDPDGRLLCGLRAWQGRARSSRAAERIQGVAGDEGSFARRADLPDDWRDAGEASLAVWALSFAGGPVSLDELAQMIGGILGIKETRQMHSGARRDDQPAIETIPDAAPSPLTTLAEREQLQILWSEIQTLPVRQRTALLLNLRDADGRGVIGLLPLTGTARLRQIAEALEMPPEELARLWRDLPLDDAAIAARLSVTRQQVINFRKCARERLARRQPAMTADLGRGSTAE